MTLSVWKACSKKMIGMFAFRVFNKVFCYDGCVSDAMKDVNSSQVCCPPEHIFLFPRTLWMSWR